MSSPPNFYADWRVCNAAATLRDGRAAPPEKLLQAVWQHQRLRRDSLNTADGETLRILHPGFRNREAGPDFRGAVIQVGDERPRVGDVEVDLVASGWRAHGHDRNPNYQQVILHVVWELPPGFPALAGAGLPATGGTPLPTLGLRDVLDAPLADLELWLGGAGQEVLPEDLRGRCCVPMRKLSPARVTELLHQAARLRLRSKAAWFQARARQAGWDQALWEGLFRALGYKQNVWPLQRLAELRPQWLAEENPTPLILQARLLGVGGLLPAELTRSQAGGDGYLRRVWDLWWRERDGFGDVVLPRTLWRFSGLRPANHPARRLALAAHWLAAEDLPERLEHWCVTAAAPTAARRDSRWCERSLLEILQVKRDDFWSWHWSLRSPRLGRPQPLLGAARVTDLAINVILPWLWSRASEGGNETLRVEIERRYDAWPPAEDNALLKLARQRLLGGTGPGALRGAADQQGLLQVIRDFCEHSNAICEDCEFPDLVQAWEASLK